MFTWTSSYKDRPNIFTLVHLDLTIHHTGKAGTWRSTERPSCYRPQTKFAKVMFSQVSVCPREVWQTPPRAGTPPWAGIAPGQVHPPGKVQPPQAGTSPQAGTPPLARYTPRAGTSSWAGTHPRALASCSPICHRGGEPP